MSRSIGLTSRLCRVIELSGSKVKDPYKELAHSMDVPYHSLRCEPETTDIVVDTESLVDRIEVVIGNNEWI